MFQANQSDLDFLYGLARRAGFDCRVDGDTLLFKKPAESSDAPGPGRRPTTPSGTQLVWGDEPRRVPGPDERGRPGRARSRSAAGTRRRRRRSSAQAHADRRRTPSSPMNAGRARRQGRRQDARRRRPPGVRRRSDADALAEARAEQIGSAAFEATAVAIGSTRSSRPARRSASPASTRRSTRQVGRSRARATSSATARTTRRSSSRAARTARSSGSCRRGSRGAGERYYGVVDRDRDRQRRPGRAGRVKVKFPWLADDAVSYWARLAAPGAGKDTGVIWVPQVNDEVLVAFEHGDMRPPGRPRRPVERQGHDPVQLRRGPRRRHGHVLRVHLADGPQDQLLREQGRRRRSSC